MLKWDWTQVFKIMMELGSEIKAFLVDYDATDKHFKWWFTIWSALPICLANWMKIPQIQMTKFPFLKKTHVTGSSVWKKKISITSLFQKDSWIKITSSFKKKIKYKLRASRNFERLAWLLFSNKTRKGNRWQVKCKTFVDTQSLSEKAKLLLLPL